jgi:hypothetical protein
VTDTDDIVAITQLVVRERESRDCGFWNRMRDCFHPDSEVNISWFRGNGYDFVEGSKDMAARGMRAKHRLGPVLVTLGKEPQAHGKEPQAHGKGPQAPTGQRALASLSGIIDIPETLDGKDFTLSAHCMMYYRVEKRAGTWRLASFEVVYRRDEFVPAILGQTANVPVALLASYRPAYRNLCYSLRLKGYTPNNALAGEDRPDTVRDLLESMYSWLGLPMPD